MIKMNRNNVGLFRWDGRSSLRDTAPCNQPGNRQLRPDDGNRGIDGNIRRLVHGEILRHLRAIGACLGLQASARNPDSVRRCEFYSRQSPTRRRPVTLLRIEEYHLFLHIFRRGDRDFRQESTISVFFDKPRTGNCLPATSWRLSATFHLFVRH